MNCKICGGPVKKPKAEVPGKFVWCSQKCWAAEGEIISKKIKAREPFEWSPVNVIVR